MLKLSAAYKSTDIENSKKNANKRKEKVEIIFIFPMQIVL